jgi:glycosyltransferase involved in cell wall biosynthesis
VIPTGIDLAELSGGDGGRFRDAHGIDRARPVIVTVSRLAIEKNIEFLLEVARELVGEFPDLLFAIAGEGPDAKRLEARSRALGLGQNARFFGNLDRRTTLLDCYRAGDAFVFASPTETQGLVLLEALALGVPVVSTAQMGTKSVLAHARGAVVSPPEVTTFARRVAELLRSTTRRAQLSIAAREDARAWSATEKVGDVVALYESLRREWPDAAGAIQPADS